MTAPPRRIGVIGLGNMGWPMAANLLKAGFEIAVADARPGRAAQFARDLGGRPTGYSDLNPTIPVGTPNATMTSTDATFSYAFFFAAANGTGAKFTDFVVATPSSAIPEPSALGLMSLAGMGILLLGRKRKSA